MEDHIYRTINMIATNTKLNIGLFSSDEIDNYYNWLNLSHSINNALIFDNASRIHVYDRIHKLQDCFYTAGLEYDLVWIDGSRKMTADMITYLGTHARNTTGKTSIILT